MSGTGLGPSPVSREGVGREEAASDEFLGELDLAGGEGSGGGFGKGAVKELVIEKLVGDLGESVGREDGDGEGEAVVWIVVVLLDGGRSALTEFHLPLKARDAEVLGHMKVIEKDFFERVLSLGGRGVSVATEFLQHLLRRGFGVISLGKPKQNQIKLFLHLGWGAELVEGGGGKKLSEVFFGDFDPLEF